MQHIQLQYDREGKESRIPWAPEERENGERGRGNNYSREAIVSNISTKGGRLFEGGD